MHLHSKKKKNNKTKNSHPSVTANKAIHNLKKGVQNQQEHHTILTKYETVHPTVVSYNNS